jgi:hypothetical protein
MAKLETKAQVVAALVKEGFADNASEALMMLEDMGIKWQDVRDGKWY